MAQKNYRTIAKKIQRKIRAYEDIFKFFIANTKELVEVVRDLF